MRVDLSTSSKQKTVCVIGAGIAGLVTAKVLTADGFHVCVYDKMPELGGVWESSRTYPGLRANNSGNSYRFSDFPYPPEADEFPTAPQIRNYLHRYVDHFGLHTSIHLNTSVENVRRGHQGRGFEVSLRSRTDPGGEPSIATQTLVFDHVVVCSGVFSDPLIPNFDGAERFAGQIVHSSQVGDADQFKGKRVVVVGAAKSALDCAALASRHADSVTLLYRRPHWMMPRHLPNGKRGEEIFFNRFVAALTVYHRQSWLNRWLHVLAAPLIRRFWNFAGKALIRDGGIPAHMQPETPLPAGLVFAGVGTDFFKALASGKVTARRGFIRQFCSSDCLEVGLTLTASASNASGEKEGAIERWPADMVVMATGWRQPLDFLSEELQAEVRPGSTFRLFRRILPPRVTNLGFIGFASSTACQLTSELAAHWLSEVFLGRLSLPSVESMEAEIDRVQRWTDAAVPGRSEGYFIGGYLVQYLDELLDDMRLPRRRCGNPITEYFGFLAPDRWRDVGIERRRRAKETPSARSAGV